MTKRHFEALAAAFQRIKPTTDAHSTAQQFDIAISMWREAIDTVARVAEQDNPRFNRGRFLRACGLE